MSLNKILKARGLVSMEEYAAMVNRKTFISTGYPDLDEAIHPVTEDCPTGGGIPTGCITEIFGMSATGKSRFIKDICLRPDIRALYIDTENSLAADELNYMLEHCDVISENLLENIWGITDDVLDENMYDIIVVDSLAACTTNAEIDEDNNVSMSSNMSKAKLTSVWLRKMIAKLRTSNTAFVFINHKKISPGVVKAVVTPGGEAVKFYSSLRLDFVAPTSKLKGSTQGVEVKIAKSRFSEKNTKINIKLQLDSMKDENGQQD